MRLTDEQRARFEYHPAGPATGRVHQEARDLVLNVADELVHLLPFEAGRERALVLTHLEEALMWANKGIAVHSPRDDG